MNISECVTAIIAIQNLNSYRSLSALKYRAAIAEVLQELIDTQGVGEEFLEKEQEK